MADNSIKQGEDKKIPLVIKKAGVNVDISDAVDIKAKLLIGGKFVKNYSLTPETDHGTLELDGVNNYQVNLFLERADTISFPLGKMTLALVIAFEDTDFPNGERNEEFPFNLGIVRVGNGADLNII